MLELKNKPMTLQVLIEKECTRMGVTDLEFTRLIGIKKFHKVKPFIKQVKGNQMGKMIHMRHQMANVLDVPIEKLDRAIQASKDAYYGKIDADWRAAFQPHAVLVTANKIPRPIFVAVMTGSAQKLYIIPPDSLSKLSWPVWLARNVPEELPAFGKIEGFVINYTPDHAVRFDLVGNPVETLNSTYRRGLGHMRGISPQVIGAELSLRS